MADLAAYESEVHAGCGQHDSIAGTTDKRLEPVVCQDCADIEVAMRVQAERDKAADKAKYGPEPPAEARLAADGRRWSMRQLPPDEVAAEKPSNRSRARRSK